ncbi:serine hydrolase domain-containing protein [Zobellia galactanivorans]|uniref:serine hydrolase domain-containing protein n=1 Tax=Zobellia galactanivorans (strain DSM 12802 / CCUG 47099 / CIP 106680 / NCIMB 13871 / Dsij) TaxID=63186 RepID=UPI0026E31B4C|nr:serine hydrolase domain-containing protein [Zobellia galactanivorans]MDO6809436.1 serine hydrolase domain-containing protein [Zobellia galactanivorans]
MNPILKYIENLFAKKRVLGNDPLLNGLVEADRLLLDLVSEEKVPGLAITVLKQGEPFFQKGYGLADLERKLPVDPQSSVFRIASVSKPIAATALAYMVGDNLIDLDASFYTYVPYFPKKKYDFTIRQLASHTAGIRGYRGIEYGLNKPYTIKEGIEIFKDDELLFKPGTDYLYNSFDWVLISLAIQEVSGIPFETYVQEKVLAPLGMDRTSWPDLGHTQVEPCFYSKNKRGFRKAIPVNNHYKMAGGGFLSTTPDIAKFGQAYLEGRVLTPRLRNEFLRAQKVDGSSIYYGLGWQVSQDAQGRPYYGHVGNGVGGYSNFFVYPEEEMVFSILINCTDPKVQPELDVVIDCLIRSKEGRSGSL